MRKLCQDKGADRCALPGHCGDLHSPTGLSLQGVITVKGPVDREKGDFYTLTVVADDGGPKVDSTVVSGSGYEPGFQSVSTPSASKPAPPSHPTHRGVSKGQQWARVRSC